MLTLSRKADECKPLLTGPKPHEQADADACAGMGAPDNGKKTTKLPPAAAAAADATATAMAT